MENLPEIANAIATLLFTEAAKEGGKSIGKGVTEKLQQMTLLVRQQFKASGTEDILNQAEKHPTNANIDTLKKELVAQMKGDESLVNQLRQMILEIKGTDTVRQVAISGIKAKSIDIDIELTQQAGTNSPKHQEFATGLEADEVTRIRGTVTQKS